MSPLDDELRSALHSRTSSITSSPDLFSGVEQRARRMRRTRAAGAVAGSALAVSALGLGGPLVASSLMEDGRTTDRPPLADPEPTLVPASPYALDPDDPWAFRGDEKVLADGSLGAYAQEWAVRHRVDVADVTFWPLFGQVDEPSLRAEVVYVATVDSTGEAFWGVTRSSEAGPDFPVDQPLADGTTALPAALPGDEVGRLLVVAAPETSVQYSPGDGTWISGTADGTMQVPLEGDPESDLVRVIDPQDEVVFSGPAPDAPEVEELAPPAEGTALPGPEDEGPGTDVVPGDEVPAPSNVVDWPVRGGLAAELEEQAVTAFASAAGVSRDEVGTRLLYAGERDGAVYVLLQGWAGGDARTFAWRWQEDGSQASVLQGFTAPGPAVLAASLDGVLVVVPEPRAGQVLYSADGTSEPEPVADQGTEAAVLVERPETRTGDRLLVLDGNGDPDRPVYRGSVEELLASLR